MGTDQLGRDLFSRVIVATRLDMAVAIFSVALVFVLGVEVGHVLGRDLYFGLKVCGRVGDVSEFDPLRLAE